MLESAAEMLERSLISENLSTYLCRAIIGQLMAIGLDIYRLDTGKDVPGFLDQQQDLTFEDCIKSNCLLAGSHGLGFEKGAEGPVDFALDLDSSKSTVEMWKRAEN